MTIEAMKQALEALEKATPVRAKDPQMQADAIVALRTAIEAAEKMEPRCAVIVEVFGKDWRLDYMSLPVGKHRLYTQEYVYTTPPAAQRTWVGLTDKQIALIAAASGGLASDFVITVARAIEAKLKEKNNG
jgi:hypothetical protein